MNNIQQAEPQAVIVRPVELLRGSREIAQFLGVRKERVLEMQKTGAPIIADDQGKLRAEKAELWSWWTRQVWGGAV